MSQLSQNCWALEVANGDGTVPLISAQASSWSPAENVHWVRETHAGLPGNQHVISAVEAILSGGKPSTLLNAPSRFSPLTQASLCTVSMVSPAKLSQAQAIESEPVATLTLRTSAGELVDDEHEGLVGSGHVRIGNGFHIWAPLGAGNQTIEIGGMDSGILSLEISEFGQDGELRRRTGFDNVAVQRGSVGSVEVSDSGPSALNYDLTGGGDPQEIAPSEVVTGTAPTFINAGVVNSASFTGGPVAPGQIISIFGQNLAGSTALAKTTPLPTTLEGASVTFNGIPAALFYVSPTQINTEVPGSLRPGPATMVIGNGNATSASQTIQVNPIAPGLFTATATGQGLAAAVWLKVAPDGTRTEEHTFDNSLQPVPADPSGEDEFYLLLFGTGIRGFSGAVTATVGGVEVPVLGAVAQGEFVGLDQVNIGPLPETLAGKGVVTVALTIDRIKANEVTVEIGGSGTALPPVPRLGLIAHYPLEGNLSDESGNKLDGAECNPLSYSSDAANGLALHMDRADDYGRLPSTVLSPAGSFSISVWFKNFLEMGIRLTQVAPISCGLGIFLGSVTG